VDLDGRGDVRLGCADQARVIVSRGDFAASSSGVEAQAEVDGHYEEYVRNRPGEEAAIVPRKASTHRPRLAHRLDGSSEAYRLTSIAVPEVTTGTVTTEVRCRACGQPVSCVVESPRARIRRLRRWRLAYYGVLVLIGPAAMAVALLFEPTDVREAIRVGVLVAFTCGVGGSALVSVWTEIMSEHDGHEGVRLPRRHRPHSVRYANDLIKDGQGNWHRQNVGGGFRDCNAEPLIDGPL
jgi:hypothetical protein